MMPDKNPAGSSGSENPAEKYQGKGTYSDPVDKMSPAQKLPILPSAPDPKPFKIKGIG